MDFLEKEEIAIKAIDLSNPTLIVGHGENNFTMSRGSFNYKQKIHWRCPCNLIERKELEGGYELIFSETSHHTKYRLTVKEADGRVEAECELVAGAPEDVNRYWLSFPAEEKEHIYGCGETYSELDLKGKKVRIWVAEHQNAARIAGKVIMEKLRGRRPDRTLAFDRYESYYVQPTFVSSEKYFVHAFINEYAEFDFSRKDTVTLYTQEPPRLVSESAESFTELSTKLSKLLGRQRPLPKWIYEGGIIAMQDWTFEGKRIKENFDGCGNIDRKLEELFKTGAKVSGVWCQDWCGCRCTDFGYQVMWNWSYNDRQYPKLPQKIKEWKEKGVRFLGYINPFLAIEKDLYAEASKKGYCVKDRNGKDYLVTITTFPAAMVDFTNPEAYEWYKDIIKKNMIGIGMGGWMADFGEYLPVDSVLFRGDPKKLHNQWPAIWARLNREAIEEMGVSDEVFFFTRAGHTESVAQSAMMWNGDQHVDWSVDDGLPSVIPATLSLAMSGYGITHSDVGGYTTVMHIRRTKELLMRWAEMNVFSPLFRSHEGNQPSNDVQFDLDEETLNHIAWCTRLHTELGQYIEGLVRETTEKGTPVMRPLFYHYDEEPAYTEKTEYLLGRDILVAPVTVQGAKTRAVYLPNDIWIHLFTGKEYRGGSYHIASPIGQPPVFLRKYSRIEAHREQLLKSAE